LRSRKLPDPQRLLTSEGYVLTCAAFILTPLVMSLALAPSDLSFSARLFETVSAVTTTGLSRRGLWHAGPKNCILSRRHETGFALC